MREVIGLIEDRVTLRTDTPADVGSRVTFDVKMPKGVLLRSVIVDGTITCCESVGHNGSNLYIVEMVIGNMSPVNKSVLEAYVAFLEREKVLGETRVDLKGLREACSDLEAKLARLRKAADEVRSNLTGMLELARRNSRAKTTIH